MNNLKAIGIGFIYIGFILIVMAVKIPFDSKLVPIIGLALLGALNVGFYDKLKSKFWWYQPMILGVTAAFLTFPALLTSINNI